MDRYSFVFAYCSVFVKINSSLLSSIRDTFCMLYIFLVINQLKPTMDAGMNVVNFKIQVRPGLKTRLA